MEIRYIQKPSDEARWVLDTLAAASAIHPQRPWIQPSSFHILHTRPAPEHPAFGIALMLWQRIQARLGDRAAVVSAEAFLSAPRTANYGMRFAGRMLEIWCRHVPLPLDPALFGRLLPLRTGMELALLLEDLALGGFEGGRASEATEALVLECRGYNAAEAHALVQLDRFSRGAIGAAELALALVPSFAARPDIPVPAVTRRLLGWRSVFPYYTPTLTPALEAALAPVRLRAAGEEAASPVARDAATLIASCSSLTVDEVLTLAQPGRAARPSQRQVAPPPQAFAAAFSQVDALRAVRAAWLLPPLAGMAETAAHLPGLTAWVAARKVGVPATVGQSSSVEPGDSGRWSEWTGAGEPLEQPVAPLHRLARSLRTGEPIAGQLIRQWHREGGWGVDRVLFASPSGPGLLTAQGELGNGLATWEAPEAWVVMHPLELSDAERQAWQSRVCERGRAPLNQLFREVATPTERERAKLRLERGRGGRLTEAGFERLAQRGWFPLLSPAEVPAELDLGEVRARLWVEPENGGWSLLGVEFLREGQLCRLGEVPARAFSEAWRDLDEARSLGEEAPVWRATPARAELVRSLGSRLGLGPLRIEADHVAGREGSAAPIRMALANALPASGGALDAQDARALAQAVLPFDDDGGVAAVLIGRLVHLGRSGG